MRGHRAGRAGQQRQPVGAVATIGELAQRLGECVLVGEVGEPERLWQDSREVRGMVVQPASQPGGRRARRGRRRVPVEAAEREQVTQVGRRLQLDAGQGRPRLPVEQRVDATLGGEQRRVVGDADSVGACELGAAELAPRARAAGWVARSVRGGPAASVRGLIVSTASHFGQRRASSTWWREHRQRSTRAASATAIRRSRAGRRGRTGRPRSAPRVPVSSPASVTGPESDGDENARPANRASSICSSLSASIPVANAA